MQFMRMAFQGGAVGPSDPNFANVTALLHFDGANNSTVFTDQKGNTWVTSGLPVVSTTQSKFGGSSLYSPANTAYLGCALANEAFGTGDFTVEAWIYPTASAHNILLPSATANSWALITYSNNLYWQQAGSNIFGAGTVNLNAWNHVAVSRSGGTLSGYVNGVSVYSGANSYNYSGTPTRYIGPGPGGPVGSMYIDDVRLTKGTGRYTTGFTPPTAAFPNS